MLSFSDYYDIPDFQSTLNGLIEINKIRIIHMSEIKLVKNIGEGGQSTVYEGYFEENHIVFKLLNNIDYNCLLHEIIIISNLSHPYIPKFYGIVQEDKKFALIFEYIKGRNLENIKLTDISYNNKIKICKNIGSVLEYLHANHFIHRDLKPGNIIINDNFDAYLIDFGISKICTNKKNLISLTKGTSQYLAPECLEIKDINEKEEIISVINTKVDVWSFGCLISYLFSGYKPWENKYNSNDKGFYNKIYKDLIDKNQFPIPNNICKDYPIIYKIIEIATIVDNKRRANMNIINDLLYEIQTDEDE